MNIIVTLGTWTEQASAAREIRREVFILEQGVPEELEWDDMDAESVHALAHDDTGTVVGTGRLLPDGHVGRMAVRRPARGLGAGGKILCALMNAAKMRGDSYVLLHAQVSAVPFYRRYGFEAFGEEFMEAGIRHVMMKCIL